MRKFIIAFLLVCSSVATHAATLSDSARIFLVSCTPGNEAWSHYGHTALWINDPTRQLDLVFNYGIFNFNTDNFYYKFCTGDTWYQLGIESLQDFVTSYATIGRKTYWQQLNLTHEQQEALFEALLVNYQPENRFYHYNFVFDNCATRPYYLIKKVLGDTIISSYKGALHAPYRATISHYTGRYCWLDFAINMVFGQRADVPMENEQRLFLPEELMFYMAEATLSDGTPMVIDQHIEPFVVAPVVWWKDCRFGIALFTILMLLLSWYDRKRGHISWGVDAVLVFVWLILIGISVFLSNFSCHPLVGFNWRLILFPILHLCTRLVYFIR